MMLKCQTEEKFITTSEYNKFMSGKLDGTIKQISQLVNKFDISK